MQKKYKVTVNGEMEFSFSEEEIQSLDSQESSPGNFHILKNSKSTKAELQDTNFLRKQYTVRINSNTYDVRIANELDLLISEMGLTLAAANIAKDIKAPMPGLILDVLVAEGDEVKEGDYLLVLEAMKMENTLAAPRDGVVKSVGVSKGGTVDKGQVLIEME